MQVEQKDTVSIQKRYKHGNTVHSSAEGKVVPPNFNASADGGIGRNI
jgi:hypothetical protein